MSRSRPLLLAIAVVLAVVILVLLGQLGQVAPEANTVDATLERVLEPRATEETSTSLGGFDEVAASTVVTERAPIERAETAAEEAPLEGPRPPVVELLVLEDRGRAGRAPIAGLKILATEGQRLGTEAAVHVGETDIRGQLTATLPRTGWFVFHLDPGTRPAGIAGLSEFELDRGLGSGQANGVHHFAPGERAEVTLTLPAAGELIISVRDARGQPVEGARITVALRSDMEKRLNAVMRLGRALRGSTDESGRVTFSAVPQGDVEVEVREPAWLDPAGVNGQSRNLGVGWSGLDLESAGPADRLARPAPRRVRVEAGARTELEFLLGAGQHELTGRVVDEDGAPLARVQVSVHYAPPENGGVFGSEPLLPMSLATDALDVWSDEAGRFTAKGLDPGPYKLYVQNVLEADGFGLQGPRLQRWVPANESTETRIDLGDVVVPRPRIFVVRGRVVLTAASRQGRAIDLTTVRPWTMSAKGGSQLHWSYDEATGEFTTACVLPARPFQLRVGLWKGVQDYREYEFVPEAGVTLENVELRYP